MAVVSIGKGSSPLYLLALLSVGNAFPLPGAASLGVNKFAPASLAGEELQAFASCTWPLNLNDLGPRFSAPKGGRVEDSTMIIAVIVSLAFFGLAMYVDTIEFAEEEQKPKAARRGPNDACDRQDLDTNSHPSKSVVAFLVLALALITKLGIPGEVPSMCQRLPVLAPKIVPFGALDWLALEELQRLLAQTPSIVSDNMVIGSLLACCLVGVMAMLSDVEEMSMEQERPIAKKKRDDEDDHASEEDGQTSGFSFGALLYFAMATITILASISSKLRRVNLLFPPVSGPALAELRGLVSHPFFQSASPEDSTLVMMLVGFVTFGLLASSEDREEMDMEEHTRLRKLDRKSTAEGDDSSRTQDDKVNSEVLKKVSWNQYLITNWRLFACVVCYIAFCLLAAKLWQEAV